MQRTWLTVMLALTAAACAAGSSDQGFDSFGSVTTPMPGSATSGDTGDSSTTSITTTISTGAPTSDGVTSDPMTSDATSDSATTGVESASDEGSTSGVNPPTTGGSTTASDDGGSSSSSTDDGMQTGGQPDTGMWAHCTANDLSNCVGNATTCINVDDMNLGQDGFCSSTGCVDPQVDCDPVPQDSDASAICVEAQDGNMNPVFLCALDCSSGQTCPAQMVCVQNLSFGPNLPVYSMCM